MVSLAGKTINVISMIEKIYDEYILPIQDYVYDGTNFKPINLVPISKYYYELQLIEDNTITLTSSIAEDVRLSFVNSTTMTFVCDFSFHNRGSLTVMAIAPPIISYDVINELRTIIVKIIEV
ncbi:MAG: hypothetical protein QW156_03840 [Candidatus Aenigmatarchaeota archaeon]